MLCSLTYGAMPTENIYRANTLYVKSVVMSVVCCKCTILLYCFLSWILTEFWGMSSIIESTFGCPFLTEVSQFRQMSCSSSPWGGEWTVARLHASWELQNILSWRGSTRTINFSSWLCTGQSHRSALRCKWYPTLNLETENSLSVSLVCLLVSSPGEKRPISTMLRLVHGLQIEHSWTTSDADKRVTV